MTPAPGTIDLGELPPGGAPENDPPPPVRDRLRRWHGHHHRRRLAGAAAAALLVLSFASSAAPAQPAATAHFTVSATGFLSDQRHLYVVEQWGEGLKRLTAYRLDDGAVQWQTPLPAGDAFWSGYPEEGVLVTMALALPEDGRERITTAAFDAESGRRLWTWPGHPRGQAGGRILLDTPPPEPAQDPETPVGSQLMAVDLATGEPAWPAPVPVWNYGVGSGEPARLVTTDPDGRLTAYDAGTGEQLAATRVFPPGPAADLGLARTDTTVVGSLALVQHRAEEFSTTTAYDLAALTRQWMVTERVGSSLGYWDWPSRCGSLICLSGQRTPRALDPETGETVWTLNWLPAGDPEAWYTVYQPDLPQLAGHLVVSHGTDAVPGDEPGQWLVDASTGEPALDLRGWELAAYPSDLAGGAAAPVPMVKRTSAGAVWIGRLRPDLSGVDPLAAIETPGDCQVQHWYALCWHAQAPDPETAAELEVWRLRW